MPCIHLDSPNEGWHGPPTQNPRSVCCAGTLGASPTQSLMNCTAGWICLSIASIRSCFYRKHTGPSRQNGQQADGLSYIPVLPSIKEVVFLRSLTRIYAPLLPLRTRELLPGRLQHTRVPMDSGISIDIFNVYQYAWDARAPPVEQLNRRQALLDLLENAVREIPQSKSLLVCW